MVAHVNTVAFQGIDTLPIDVQVTMAGGLPAFTVVGLRDEAVGTQSASYDATGRRAVSAQPRGMLVGWAPQSARARLLRNQVRSAGPIPRILGS